MRLRLILPLCALPLVFSGAEVSSSSPFTLEQVLSAPFPEVLTPSPSNNSVAWIQNASGIRNIWVAKAPDYRAVQITSFTADDGEDLDDLAWSPDESHVFFRRGEGPNGRGEFPNPRSNPAGTREEIWQASLSGPARRLADGHSPAISPDGRTLAFLLSGQIWSMPPDGSGKPAQWIHARGSASNLRWSPDSSHLAFVSSRGDHAFIGVYDVEAASLRFLDPSVDTDQRPSWSPDGRQLAFIRVPASTDFEYGPRPTGQPWSIHVSTLRPRSSTQQVWRAEEGKGSVFWPTRGQDQLLWLDGGWLTFPWEHDSWLHLYGIHLDGLQPSDQNAIPRQSMTGSFEVEHVAIAPDRKSLVYSSNQDDADRRHLWSVSFDGKPPRRLTRGNGIEWSPVPLNQDRIAFIHADARKPARVALREKDGTIRDLAPATIPTDFPAGDLVEPQPVIITAADGLPVHGQLFLPKDAVGRRHPAVVFLHGGSRRQMLLGWHYMGYYNNAYAFNQYLASRGYAVLSLNYRSGIGYGLEFREAPHYGATGASEFNDVLGAAAYLRTRPEIDPARLSVWGGSYGGYLTALALARASDTFIAGVDLHGVHDWNLEVTSQAPARDREKRQAIEKLAFESSPLSSIHTWRSPVLLIQGDDDRTVVFAQTVQLTEALRRQGVHVEQLIFPDEVHEFLLHSNWLAAYHAAEDFLNRYLKP